MSTTSGEPPSSTTSSCVPAVRARKMLLPIVVGTLIGVALGCPAPALSDPPGGEQSPYPVVTRYPLLDKDDFRLPGSTGVWFLSTSGLNCGIWDGGSFGCAGEIPGAPPGTSRIGYFRGEPRVHYDWTVGARWPAGQAQRVLPLHSSVMHDGTTCSTSQDGSAQDGSMYCERGHFRFFVTPIATWLN
jgi:hypothetical protein